MSQWVLDRTPHQPYRILPPFTAWFLLLNRSHDLMRIEVARSKPLSRPPVDSKAQCGWRFIVDDAAQAGFFPGTGHQHPHRTGLACHRQLS